MHCAIYARYSSDSQSPTSIDDQIRKCREYAAAQGWEIAENEICADYGGSGCGLDRPAIARLLDLAASPIRSFQIVLVDDSSRISRNLADAIRVSEQLTFLGVRLIFISQGIDSTN